MRASIASLWGTLLSSLIPCSPSRCPYCPDRPQPHWIHWGSYERYAERRRERIDVDRHRCRFTRRTFSLLPDGLLPYHHLRSATILRRLWQIFVDEAQTSPLARLLHTARTNLCRLGTSFAGAVRSLRLPDCEGALDPAEFLRRIVGLGPDRIAQIFRTWKELEPKHSIVGFYAR